MTPQQRKAMQIIEDIKSELEKADGCKDATNMLLVIKNARHIKHIDPLDFVRAIGRKDSYVIEFKKGLKIAKVMEDRNLEIL